MADFKSAYRKSRKWEGGWVNEPGDRGGETYCGVARNFFPHWPGWAIVDRHKPLRKQQVIKDATLEGHLETFYKTKFWDPLRGDEIYSQAVAERYFDFGLTSGPAASVKMMQRSLGLPENGIMSPSLMKLINDPTKQLLK
ncbi:hypothetical protein LL912_00935 [Niabella sp. CC-SYL272]|uniref:glycosyl hydrolase 108 family protein n=1 Tax=Niabella agricola TaxID=2891571 RepID=UPI001F19E1F9|nr:glycosyl hydrolase 108 family protein [Niabella agricola]MCF3107332.1 hypothetical protein [Niabella agricola]